LRIGALVGRAAVVAGAIVLAFAAFQLWGTGVREARAQEDLADRLAADLAAAGRGGLDGVPAAGRVAVQPIGLGRVPDDAPLVGPPARPAPLDGPTGEPPETPLDGPAGEPLGKPVVTAEPEIGEAFASLRIPAIALDKTVVEGTTREALRTGPGHYRGTARPGHSGNVAIAGHRTTYGAPFRDIDRLRPGDAIIVETVEGSFTYRVEAQVGTDGTESGHRIVDPEQVEVIADRGDDRLTLTACHPLYSARQRIVVTALLDGPTVAPPRASQRVVEIAAPPPITEPASDRAARGGAPPTERERPPTRPTSPDPAGSTTDDLGWQRQHLGPTLWWAALTAAIGLAAWVLGRLWRRWPAYATAGPAFALALLTCFAHLDRLLPVT
jgi:sortase A